MKRILSLLLAACLVTVILPVTAFAAWSAPAIELSVSDYDEENEQITATVTIGAATNLGAFDIQLNYPAGMLTVKNVAYSDQFTDTEYNKNLKEPGEIRLGWAVTSGTTGKTITAGNLMTVVFDVTSSGNAAFSLTDYAASEFSSTASEVNTNPGANVSATQKVGTGVTVSGEVVSYGSDETVLTTIELWAEDGDSAAYSTTVAGTGAKTYSIAAVAPGKYTMKVMKAGHAPYTTAAFTVASAAVTQDATIYMLGDANKDGVLNGQDMQRLYEHLNGSNPLAEDEVIIGNVNGDGVTNGQDMQRLYEHLNGSNKF